MLLNDAMSPARLNNSDDKSADSCWVKPIPCATDPNTEINCCASAVVNPNKFAFSASCLLSCSAAPPKVVPKAPAASWAELAAWIADKEKSKRDLAAKPAAPTIAVAPSPDIPAANCSLFFAEFLTSLSSSLVDLDTLSNPWDVLLAPVSFRNISKVALAIISSVLL